MKSNTGERYKIEVTNIADVCNWLRQEAIQIKKMVYINPIRVTVSTWQRAWRWDSKPSVPKGCW